MVFSPGLLEGAPQTHIATVRADATTERALERAVAERFPNVSAIRVRDVMERVAEIIGNLGVVVRAGAAVAIAAGPLVLGGDRKGVVWGKGGEGRASLAGAKRLNKKKH